MKRRADLRRHDDTSCQIRQISLCSLFVLVHSRGASGSSVAWDRNAVDVTRRARVLARADERCVTDGEGVWSWRLGAGVKLATMLAHRADDGGNQADPRGERAGNR
ncbi:hypothetical protein BRAS3843_200013 [Bradyrhizobium sp. STM 3843]|nr:hypothetical protein BRAS3843_200013 [Bradyrhizobium sp. STM 3843]